MSKMFRQLCYEGESVMVHKWRQGFYCTAIFHFTSLGDTIRLGNAFNVMNVISRATMKIAIQRDTVKNSIDN